MPTFRSELIPMLRLALPVVLAELGWMSMGIVDTIMVAPLGPAAIGATGVGSSLHMAVTIFGMGLLLGLDTLVAQAHGAGDRRECHRWLVHGVVLATMLMPPSLVVCLLVLDALPGAGFHADVLAPLDGYFGVALWSTIPLLLYAAVRRYLQGMHVVLPLTFALVSANVVNAVANWALIHGHLGFPSLGVTGAAWATLCSRLYMLAVLAAAAVVVDRASRGAAFPPVLRVSTARLARLWRLGFPAASQISIEVGAFAFATALAGRLDPVSSAAHQIALNIAGASFMVPLGLSAAAAVRVGHRVGANDPPGAERAGRTAMALGAGFMLAMALVFVLMPGTLTGLFSPGPDVVALSAPLLLIAAVFQLFDGLQAVATGALRGLGSTRMAMAVNFAGHWLCGLPVAYWLCFVAGYGVRGLWVGLSIGLIVCGVALTWYWQRRITRYVTTGGVR